MRTITAIIVIIISFSISVINLVIVNNSAIVFRIITLVQSLGIITIISSSISVIQLHHQQNHPMKITFFFYPFLLFSLSSPLQLPLLWLFFFFYRCHHHSTVLIFFIILPFFSFFSSTMPPSFTFFLSYRCNDYQHQRHYHCLYLEHSYLLHITAIMMLLPISFLHIHPFFFFLLFTDIPRLYTCSAACKSKCLIIIEPHFSDLVNQVKHLFG